MRAGLGLVILCSAMSTPGHAEQYFVDGQAEYARIASRLTAGDTVILANGEWRDFDLQISGEGSEGKPITLMAEQPGQVFLTGRSSLRLGGNHILVTGLVFKDGYSPRGEVISFRTSKENVANNSRVTATVIDGFSKPDRYDGDDWVALFGRNNRFDHNHLVGKTNQGVTLVVRLDAEESRQNRHRIDGNYFGPRPVLGSNGGETIRIGTSTYSMYDSETLVENNVFDRCDGEIEIISSKSGRNVFRNNLFLRSSGTLTLRHGDNNLVERNVFLGGGKDHTGGIRVINKGQVVRFNYMEGLRGTGFASALTMMNGVPNSPVNRYVQVQNARVERNTVVDSTRVTFGAGADDERSAPPVSSVFDDNLLLGSSGNFVAVGSDISGVAFTNNAILPVGAAPSSSGFESFDGAMARAENGLLYPVDPALADVGAPRDLTPVSLEGVGVPWYEKPADEGEFGYSGRVHEVLPIENALVQAVAVASEGDTLVLRPGVHVARRPIALDKMISIQGAAHAAPEGVAIRFDGPALFELTEGGSLRMADVLIAGALAADSPARSVIRTVKAPMQSPFRIELDRVIVKDFGGKENFDVISLGEGSFADRVSIKASDFFNITGAIVSAAPDLGDAGRYNVEYVDIANSTFSDISGPVASVYRRGRDESTFGPHVTFSDNLVSNVGDVGGGAESETPSLDLHGAQWVTINGNSFVSSGAPLIAHTVGKPKTKFLGNTFVASRPPVVSELEFRGPPRFESEDNMVDGVLAK